MSKSRKRPGIVFWATVVLAGLPVAYLASFGPACWWFSDDGTREMQRQAKKNQVFWMSGPIDFRYVPHIYWPVGWIGNNGPRCCRSTVTWYATLGISKVRIPADMDARSWVFASRRYR